MIRLHGLLLLFGLLIAAATASFGNSSGYDDDDGVTGSGAGVGAGSNDFTLDVKLEKCMWGQVPEFTCEEYDAMVSGYGYRLVRDGRSPSPLSSSTHGC